MDTFKIGEIAIINSPGSKYHGQEVCIKRDLYIPILLSDEAGRKLDPEFVYGVELPGDPRLNLVVPPHHLRKKRPPKEPLGSWDLCHWNPYKQVKHA